MYVNPFWFGVLMTIVAGLMFFLVLAIIQSARSDDDDLTEDEYREILEEMTGEKIKVVTKNGVMIGMSADKDEEPDKEGEGEK